MTVASELIFWAIPAVAGAMALHEFASGQWGTLGRTILIVFPAGAMAAAWLLG